MGQVTSIVSFFSARPWALLLLILLVALGLRMHGLYWDSGHGFHPDERSIYMRVDCIYNLLSENEGYANCLYGYPAELGIPSLSTFLDAERSPLNPHWFPLGSVLLYLLTFLRWVLGFFTEIGSTEMRYIGRGISGLADVGALIMVFLLGRKMFGSRYGPWVGLLAAALSALAVMQVQNSHFYRPETFLGLFGIAIFWAALRMVELGRPRDSVLLGVFVGFFFSLKVSSLPIVLPLALAYFYRWQEASAAEGQAYSISAFKKTASYALLGAACSLVVFFLVTPYSLLDISTYVEDQLYEVAVARRSDWRPYTAQYAGTMPFVYQFHQLTAWGMGWPLGLAAWLGVAFAAVMAWRGGESRRADLLLLLWIVPNILLLETFETRFQRFYYPLIPFVILLGARFLLWPMAAARGALSQAADSVREAHRRGSRLWGGPSMQRIWLTLSWALVIGTLAATAFYSLAFQRVYANPHPAVAASQWINENIPQGAAIVNDNHWDDSIPGLHSYEIWQFPIYEGDHPDKMAQLAARLASSELVVFYSHRTFTSVARDPERFPYSRNYHQRLFDGRLGYYPEKVFTSFPSLAGVAFVDDPYSPAGLPKPEPPTRQQEPWLQINLGYADDNVVGYDHPQSLVFRNVERLSEENLAAQLLDFTAPETGHLMLSDEQRAQQQAGGTWSEIYRTDSWTNRVPALAWLLAVELIYLAALPLVMVLFRALPDRGIVLGRILGLLLTSYLVWIAVSLGWFRFSAVTIAFAIMSVALLSGLAAVFRWRELLDFLRHRWRLLLIGEALFLLAFLAFVIIRAYNPDLWTLWRGGEKPMELAYLNAVVRSTTLPPYDPWFAGGYLNYYYWGYFVLALPIRLTGIVTGVAFNLAVPLLFALTITGAYSLVYNLAQGWQNSRKQTPPAEGAAASVPAPGCNAQAEPGKGTEPVAPEEARAARFSLSQLWRHPVAAGLVGALFVGVIANLDGMLQLIQGSWVVLINDDVSFPSFDFWRSSRMLPNSENFAPNLLAFWVPGREEAGIEVGWHITEFPFFTFLFADLHAHMMAIPFSLLALGLGLNLMAGCRQQPGWAWSLWAAALLGLAVGALWLINTWDYPSYLMLSLGLVGLAACCAPGEASARVAKGVTLAVVMVLTSVVPFLPFHLTMDSFGTFIEASRWRTPLERYVAIHGLFLFIVVSFLAFQARRSLLLAFGGIISGWRLPGSSVGESPEASASPLLRVGALLILGIGLAAAVYLLAAGYWTAGALMTLLTVVGLVIWRELTAGGAERPYSLFPLALLSLALLIGIGVELVRFTGDIGRMNSLFKYYLEAWVLFGVASAYMLWRLSLDWSIPRLQNHRWAAAWVGVLVFLVASGLVYAVMGTDDRLADRFNSQPPTLDGMAYMDQTVYLERGQPIQLQGDAQAMRWLQDNVPGSPVVLEAHTEQYRWGARIANYTGLPTILGWPWHQIQQRGSSSKIADRARDVATIYETEDLSVAQNLLRQYGVRYVVVGELERIYYPDNGLAKFDTMARQGVASRAFDNGNTAIYQLVLDDASAAALEPVLQEPIMDAGTVTTIAVIRDLLVILVLAVLVLFLAGLGALLVSMFDLLKTLKRIAANAEEASTVMLSTSKDVAQTLSFFGTVNRIVSRATRFRRERSQPDRGR